MAWHTTVRKGDVLEINGSRIRVTRISGNHTDLAFETPTDIRITKPCGNIRAETTKDRAKVPVTSVENP